MPLGDGLRRERDNKGELTLLEDRRLLAIVPAYNEAASISDVVRTLRAEAPEFDVIVVDDGSTDGTTETARRAGVAVLRLPFNLGIGGAVQTGFVYALEHGYDYMAQVDGDGQHEPAELDALLLAITADPSVDMVCGSRFLSPETTYSAPVSRRTGIHLFAFALSKILGQRITDPTSGFRIYNRRAIRLFAHDYPHDYPEVEAVLMLHTHRLRMAEVPVEMHQRGGGRSSITRTRSLYYMLKVSLALLVGLLRRHPVIEAGDPAPVAATRRI
jgi:glycosyltransferase involved in cell wall biosynthesis